MSLTLNQYIDVDLSNPNTIQIVHMKQGDILTRNITVRFFNNSIAYSIPNDVTSVSLSFCKEDGVHGCYDRIDDTTAYSFNGDRTAVTMSIHPQVLIAAGEVICELKLLDNDARALNTFNFIINAEKSPQRIKRQSSGYWNNVFDGATFTPHVSNDGILSWTNDKDLPNPDPIDLKDFVVDPWDMPVVPMDIVTSENAVANVNSDAKLITPAGVKKIVDEYGGAQNILVFHFKEKNGTWSCDEGKDRQGNDVNIKDMIYDALEKNIPIYVKSSNPRLMPMIGINVDPSKNTHVAFFGNQICMDHEDPLDTSVSPGNVTASYFSSYRIRWYRDSGLYRDCNVVANAEPAMLNPITISGKTCYTAYEAISLLAAGGAT